MTSRERVRKTLTHEPVDRVPRNLWALPGVTMYRKQEFDALRARFPDDFTGPTCSYGAGRRCQGTPNEVGSYRDAWGSVWSVGEPGVIGEVKQYPLADWSALDHYRAPWELLDEADLSQVDASCRATDKFVIVGTETRPFERMQFLRGTENLLMDLAMQEKEVFQLRDMLHGFSLREMKLWADTAVDAVSFMDDWGTQLALIISPDLWRSFFKPMYKEYCDILHKQGKFVFFHSDGNIQSIYPDLIEVGIDAVNSQLFCMDIDYLGAAYAGRVTFWGEICRQHILPFGTPEDVRRAVDRVAQTLMPNGRTGVIAQCEWGTKDPTENIAAVFETWDRI